MQVRCWGIEFACLPMRRPEPGCIGVLIGGGRVVMSGQRVTSKYAEGMYRLAEQWPYLRYLGLGAWWAWIWLCYSGTGLYSLWPAGTTSFARQVGSMYLFSTPAIMCALLVAAALWRKATPLLAKRPLVVGVSCLGVLGSLLIAFAPWMGPFPAFELGTVLTGVGTSVLALKTGEAYGTLGGREVLTAGYISLVFAAFLYFMGIGIPPTWQPVYIAAMPLVSALLFVMPGDDPFPADEMLVACEHESRSQGLRRTPGMRSYVRLVLAAALVSVTAGFARGIASASMPDGGYAQTGAVTAFAVCAAALVICLMVNSGDLVRSVRRVYALLVVLGVAVVFASAFGLNLVYLGVGKELLWMMFTCLMAYTAFRFGFSPVHAFGIGQAVYLGSSAASWGLGIMCAGLLSSPSTHLVVIASLMFAIVALFAFVFTDSDIKFIFTWKHEGSTSARGAGEAQQRTVDAPAGAVAGNPSMLDGLTHGTVAPAVVCSDAELLALDPAALERAIAAIPETVGISVREAQIMALFAQGRSANWIAEDLVISKNTVRSHIRSIYTKLDVHSRKELLAKLAQG